MDITSPHYDEATIEQWRSQMNQLRPEDFDSRNDYLTAMREIEQEIEDACRLGPLIPAA